MLVMSLCVITVCILLPGDKACCHLMPCCFVLCFQGKARCESAERKVSTTLILHGDLGLLGGEQWDLEIWSFFSVFLHKHPSSRSPPSLFLYFEAPAFDLLLKFTQTHTHETLHNGITWPDELLREISTQFSGDKYQLCPFRWMSDSWWGHCHPYLSFTPFSPSSIWCPRCCSFLVSIRVPLSSVCSCYWLLWYR